MLAFLHDGHVISAEHRCKRVDFQFLVYEMDIILLLVVYGCETWSLTMREERRLRVFENKMLRRIFGPKRDVVTGE
jgi:hypothetical protein